MADYEDKILHKFKSEVQAGKYLFSVEVIEKHWTGCASGKMEDMPGNFLNAKVKLLNISGNLSPIEQLALNYKPVLLSDTRKEVTNEPKGYSELFHKDLVEKVQNDPKRYVSDLQKIVKKKL